MIQLTIIIALSCSHFAVLQGFYHAIIKLSDFQLFFFKSYQYQAHNFWLKSH